MKPQLSIVCINFGGTLQIVMILYFTGTPFGVDSSVGARPTTATQLRRPVKEGGKSVVNYKRLLYNLVYYITLYCTYYTLVCHGMVCYVYALFMFTCLFTCLFLSMSMCMIVYVMCYAMCYVMLCYVMLRYVLVLLYYVMVRFIFHDYALFDCIILFQNIVPYVVLFFIAP